MATARRRSTDHFPATCTAPDLVGHFVYLDAPGSVRTVDVFDLTKIQSVGVIISKSSATQCTVQHSGEVLGLFSGLTSGRRVAINDIGLPGHGYTRPLSGMKWIQWVGIAIGADSILLELHAPIGIGP